MNLRSKLLVTEFDYKRLKSLMRVLRKRLGTDARLLAALDSELERASIVPPEQVPPGVVTMNSRMRLVDLASAKRVTGVLVFPGARASGGASIPVLSALGMRLLGRREGDTVVCRGAGGARSLLVERLLYQPEFAGNFAL